MEKNYNPSIIEPRCYRNWENNNYFAPKDKGETYCIMLPPPNVTGSLHMGHAFQQTLMDILTRYHRMQGDRTLWQCGTDHAGIATQMVVERQLKQKKTTRHELGRDRFINAVWDWKKHYGNRITQQSRRLGTSMDWSRERFTMDEGLSEAVREVFVKLYDEGLIYRGKKLVNWDPVLHTAISDLEVIQEEESGKLWHVRYPLMESVDNAKYIIVATTRPETMLGDAAVAVHPDDDRYKNLIGKHIKLPLSDRVIPIIADDYVDMEFGTGCVKITPAHDFNDYDIGQRHNLPMINIFTVDAAINDDMPSKYQKLDRYEARKLILADLKEQNLIEKIDDHKLMVPRGDRSHAVIEPYLTDQWYIKVESLAAPAIEAVEKGDIKFIPESWNKTYFDWMHNIQDWCISRQLWWGHRIPAWYDNKGNVYVGRNEKEVREKHQLKSIELTQDEDVLDTWFSSSLWPFSTLGWPNKTDDLKNFYPTNVLTTGFDIIFFWVARMIMMGLKFMGEVPFKEVYIHGLVRDSDGQKMSKSKGNVLDPLDIIDGIDIKSLIEKRTTGLMQPKMADNIEKNTRKYFPKGIAAYGTDPLRFTFSSLATQGRDIRFDIGRIEGYRNFCNKLWNAIRFSVDRHEKEEIDINNKTIELGIAENWINLRLSHTIETCHQGMSIYRFDLVSKALYEFTWNDYCDWYIEFAKITLNNSKASEAEKRGTLFTLLNIAEVLLRALHPFIPFITEELWQRIATILEKQEGSIMMKQYPDAGELKADKSTDKTIEWIKLFVMGVRRIRAERDIAPKKVLNIFIRGGSSDELRWLDEHQYYVKSIGKIGTITKTEKEIKDSVMSIAGEMNILIPLADLIDPKMEIIRLNNTIKKLDKERESFENSLNNKNYIERAPKNIVDKSKQRLKHLLNEINDYHKQLDTLTKLIGK